MLSERLREGTRVDDALRAPERGGAQADDALRVPERGEAQADPHGRGLGVTRASQNTLPHPISQEQAFCAYCHEESASGKALFAQEPGLV